MDKIKTLVPERVRGYTPLVLVAAAAGSFWVLRKLNTRLRAHLSQKRLLNRWKESPKDVVVLHTLGRGKTTPNNSPFIIKLETYLRMANIPYQLDTQYPYWPKTGKTPWITLNGQHYTDSQLIIEMLAKTYEVRIGSYSDGERALGTVLRVVMDEHFYWGVGNWRYVQDKGQDLHKIFDFPPAFLRMFRKVAYERVKANAWAQGIGRLDQADIFQTMSADLRALSHLLANKKFILGEEASENDCAVFGMLAQALWGTPGSPYEKLLKEELQNLRDYCIRMKETFWPDWDKCLAAAVPH